MPMPSDAYRRWLETMGGQGYLEGLSTGAGQQPISPSEYTRRAEARRQRINRSTKVRHGAGILPPGAQQVGKGTAQARAAARQRAAIGGQAGPIGGTNWEAIRATQARQQAAGVLSAPVVNPTTRAAVTAGTTTRTVPPANPFAGWGPVFEGAGRQIISAARTPIFSRAGMHMVGTGAALGAGAGLGIGTATGLISGVAGAALGPLGAGFMLGGAAVVGLAAASPRIAHGIGAARQWHKAHPISGGMGVGAGIGAAIGAGFGSPIAGAVIGAGAGAFVGGKPIRSFAKRFPRTAKGIGTGLGVVGVGALGVGMVGGIDAQTIWNYNPNLILDPKGIALQAGGLAAVGGLVGRSFGRPGLGALAGAAVGVAAGGIMGPAATIFGSAALGAGAATGARYALASGVGTGGGYGRAMGTMGAVGGALGGLVGHQFGDPMTGVAIGAGVGAVAGAIRKSPTATKAARLGFAGLGIVGAGGALGALGGAIGAGAGWLAGGGTAGMVAGGVALGAAGAFVGGRSVLGVVREAAKTPGAKTRAGQVATRALAGDLGRGAMRAGVKFMAKHPTMVGIGVGAVLGMRALGRGAARVMFPADQVRSFGFGTEADVMGLRANNLNTTALVQALHYRR